MQAAMATVVTAILAIGSTATSGDQVLYVDEDAVPGGDGATWESAFPHLQDALAAVSEAAPAEIRMAQGLYRPDRSEATPGGTGDRGASFVLHGTITLRGGYAGLGGPDPDFRDPQTQPTHLSGDLLADDGPEFAGTGENAFHVVTVMADAEATLDGVIIEGGNAEGDDLPEIGGGVLLGGATAVLLECVIRDNRASSGGGIFAEASVVVLESCLLTGNQVERGCGPTRGGALVVSSGSSATIQGCQFTGNAAVAPEPCSTPRGGAIEVEEDAVLDLDDCLFDGNSAVWGGAVRGGSAAVSIRECCFNGNSAGYYGGAVWLYGQGAVIEACSFTANTAYEGGAVVLRGDVLMTGCTLVGNASVRGGGAYFDNGNVVLVDCTIEANEADLGGGLYLDRGTTLIAGIDCVSNSAGLGGGLYLDEPELSLQSSLIAGNSALSGGGVYGYDGSLSMTGTALEDNDALVDGGGAHLHAITGTIEQSSFYVNAADENGGGLYLSVCEALSVSDTLIMNNLSFGMGGGLYNLASTPSFTECTFSANFAEYGGGGMAGLLAGGIWDRCRIDSNWTFVSGGAMHLDASSPTLHACDVSFNRSESGEHAAGIYNVDGSPLLINTIIREQWDYAGVGRGFYNDGGDPTLLSCTVALNWDEGLVSVSGMPIVRNCIFGHNGGGSTPDIEGAADVGYSLVEKGYAGVGNIMADPGFVSFTDLRLAPGSSAIDAGENGAVPAGIVTDFQGAARFYDDPETPDSGVGTPPIVDMGAYELQPACPADVTGDGVVDVLDLAAVITAWGDSDGDADVNLDGDVNVIDLVAVLGAWGFCAD